MELLIRGKSKPRGGRLGAPTEALGLQSFQWFLEMFLWLKSCLHAHKFRKSVNQTVMPSSQQLCVVGCFALFPEGAVI